MTTPPLIFSKMAAILSETGAITKDRKNEQQGFRFRGIDDVYNELHSLFAKHKVFITTNVTDFEKHDVVTTKGAKMTHILAKITFKFWTEDGSCVESFVVGEAMDSGDKAMNKALSVGLKYALMQAFLIPTEEDNDPDRQSHEIAKEAPRPSPAPGKFAPSAFNGPWQDVVMHFGKHKGKKLSEISTLGWYIKEWQPKPFNGTVNGADSDLRLALDEAAKDFAARAESSSQPDAEGGIDQEPVENWQDVVCHLNTKAHGKKLGELKPIMLQWLFDNHTSSATPQDETLLKALAAWHADFMKSHQNAA